MKSTFLVIISILLSTLSAVSYAGIANTSQLATAITAVCSSEPSGFNAKYINECYRDGLEVLAHPQDYSVKQAAERVCSFAVTAAKDDVYGQSTYSDCFNSFNSVMNENG